MYSAKKIPAPFGCARSPQSPQAIPAEVPLPPKAEPVPLRTAEAVPCKTACSAPFPWMALLFLELFSERPEK